MFTSFNFFLFNSIHPGYNIPNTELDTVYKGVIT